MINDRCRSVTLATLLLALTCGCQNDFNGNVELDSSSEVGSAQQALTWSGFDLWSWHSTSRVLDDNSQVKFADVNGDGKDDVFEVGERGTANAGRVKVMLGTPTGFPTVNFYSGARMLNDNDQFWLADVDGKGGLDLVARGAVGAANDGFIYVALSQDGKFPSWTWSSSGRTVGSSDEVYFADVDGNGTADLIARARGANNNGYMYVALSNGSGYPSWSWSSAGPILYPNDELYFANVDGKPGVDLIARAGGGYAPNGGHLYLASSNGVGFPSWTWSSSGRMLQDFDELQIADMNKDGMADLVARDVTGATYNNLYLSLSTGAGFLPWSPASSMPTLTTEDQWFLVDVTADQIPDIVSRTQKNNVIPSDSEEGFIYAWRSAGFGDPTWSWSTPNAVLPGDRLSLADVNGDHRADIVVRGSSNGANNGYLYVAFAKE